MITNNRQIGLSTESRSVVNPTLNSPVTSVSVYFFNKLLIPYLLINKNENDNFHKLNKIWRVNNMKYLDQFGNLTDNYYGYVYLTLDQKYNKIYIGQKKGKVEDSKNYFGSGTIITRIIKSRGDYFLKKIILGVCYTLEDLIECETECKYFFDVWNSLIGYNIAIKDYNPMSGRKQTIEHKNKISKALIGRKLSDKTKLKISIANFGKKVTLEQSKKLSKLRKGRKLKPFTEETKKKMSISAKKRKRKSLAEETKEKIRQKLLGHKHSEETKKKMSKSQKDRVRKPHTEETKKKMSISAKKRKKN